MNADDPTKQVNVSMPRSDYQALQTGADQLGLSLSAYIRMKFREAGIIGTKPRKEDTDERDS